MAEAEARSRNNRKAGPGTDRLANAARLGALERNLGVPIKRHRDPNVSASSSQTPFSSGEKQDKDTTEIVERGF